MNMAIIYKKKQDATIIIVAKNQKQWTYNEVVIPTPFITFKFRHVKLL